jgi:hypothetical protein
VANAKTKATTPRYITLRKAAARIGREELEFALLEGRLFAWDRVNWAHFEDLARFLEDFGLRGAAQADLDAVRAIGRGVAIPPKSWRRWVADGSVNWKTDEIIRPFVDRALYYQPVFLNTDIPTRSLNREVPRRKAGEVFVPPLIASPAKPEPIDAQSSTARWIEGEVRRLKATGKIREDIRITALATLLEDAMRKAAETDSSLRKVRRGHIKNMLPEWGLWPISLIKS